MSVICSSHNLSVLEELVIDLQAHSYALDLLITNNPDTWTDARIHLLFGRLDFLRQTAEDFALLEQALRQGYNLNTGQSLTPAAASDTPSA